MAKPRPLETQVDVGDLKTPMGHLHNLGPGKHPEEGVRLYATMVNDPTPFWEAEN